MAGCRTSISVQWTPAEASPLRAACDFHEVELICGAKPLLQRCRGHERDCTFHVTEHSVQGRVSCFAHTGQGCLVDCHDCMNVVCSGDIPDPSSTDRLMRWECLQVRVRCTSASSQGQGAWTPYTEMTLPIQMAQKVHAEQQASKAAHRASAESDAASLSHNRQNLGSMQVVASAVSRHARGRKGEPACSRPPPQWVQDSHKCPAMTLS